MWRQDTEKGISPSYYECAENLSHDLLSVKHDWMPRLGQTMFFEYLANKHIPGWYS